MSDSITDNMRLIQKIDPFPTLKLSIVTNQWYVSAQIEIGGDGFLTGITEHRDTPEEAVQAFVQRMQEVSEPMYLASVSPRRHYRWTGEAFWEIAREHS